MLTFISILFSIHSVLYMPLDKKRKKVNSFIVLDFEWETGKNIVSDVKNCSHN